MYAPRPPPRASFMYVPATPGLRVKRPIVHNTRSVPSESISGPAQPCATEMFFLAVHVWMGCASGGFAAFMHMHQFKWYIVGYVPS